MTEDAPTAVHGLQEHRPSSQHLLAADQPASGRKKGEGYDHFDRADSELNLV
jgi:hypothetical protein